MGTQVYFLYIYFFYNKDKDEGTKVIVNRF